MYGGWLHLLLGSFLNSGPFQSFCFFLFSLASSPPSLLPSLSPSFLPLSFLLTFVLLNENSFRLSFSCPPSCESTP